MESGKETVARSIPLSPGLSSEGLTEKRRVCPAAVAKTRSSKAQSKVCLTVELI